MQNHNPLAQGGFSGLSVPLNSYTRTVTQKLISHRRQNVFSLIVPAFFDSISITSVIGSLTIRNFKVTHTHEIYEKTRKGISSQIIRTDFRDLFVNFVGLVELLTKI